MIERYLKPVLKEHLETMRQMVFLVGPRQVGKTTLAKNLIPNLIEGVNYFNWDTVKHRKLLTTRIFPGKFELGSHQQNVIVFDEIHKYRRWKNTMKGLFDTYEPKAHWIITGSAGLNVYRKGQDSLVGRAFTYHLAPFSVAELSSTPNFKIVPFNELLKFEFTPSNKKTNDIFERLLQFGGFPEPYLKAKMTFLSRWRSSRLERLLNQDLASIEILKNLALVENLMFLLPERVGKPLSLNGLREDLEVHFATVKHWLQLLERVFYGFRIYPYTGTLARALKKEAKWYLWDWTEIDDMGVRFENMVAVHLLKYVNYINDLGLDKLSLHFVRDREKREVDFVICKKKKPVLLIECKLKSKSTVGDIAYFTKALKPKRSILLVAESEPLQVARSGDAVIEIVPATSFFETLI